MMSCPLLNSDGPGVFRRLLAISLAVLMGVASHVSAQVAPADGPAPEVEKPLTPEELKKKAAAEAKAAAALKKAREVALKDILEGTTELSPEQTANFEKWLPHTFKRLKKRAPVHIVAIGDSVTRYLSYDENLENSHYSYHGVFAAKLADEFFYTGGVRDILPAKEHAPKLIPTLGPELTLENLGMNGRLSLHAISRITAGGLVNQPDLVIINFGINDAMMNLGLATYIEALDRSVRFVKSTGADVILLGPSNMMRQATLQELALTRPYSGAMEELAARLGVFYFDLSDISMSARGTAEGMPVDQVVAQITEEFRNTTFDHGEGNVDGLHPSPKTHQWMGDAIFEALRDGELPAPFRIGGSVMLASGGAAVLEFKIKNLSDEPAKGQVLTMPVAGMKPVQASVPFELAAGKGKVFRVDYQAGGGGFKFPAGSPPGFVPMVVAAAEQSYSPVFPAQVGPVGVSWDSGSQDLTSSAFSVTCNLFAGAAAASGSYQATWNGQTSSGQFKLTAGGRQAIDLSFEVPTSGANPSVRDNLVLSVKTGGQELEFVRRMEASRNLGLGEKMDMLNPEKYVKGEPARDGRVQFSADASAKQLVLNFDAEGLRLEGDDQLVPLILEFQIDARGFGKRRKFGYVDVVRVKFGIDGKPERMSHLRPAVFGDFYDRALDKQALSAFSRILPNGRQRFTVIVPRSYLYRHEFAIGNRNSVLGVNADLFFAKAGQPTDPYPTDRHFSLVESGLCKNTAESLTVLELVSKSTGRWSVRLD